MGGKSRKTGGISKKLIDKIKAGDKLDKADKSGYEEKKQRNKPFGLTLQPSSKEEA